ncbi:MAG: uracil-DNA glycosylase [Bacteroidota bacterium]
MQVQIEPGWKSLLQKEFDKPYFEALVRFIKQEKENGKIIFPPGPQLFAAFDHTPFDKVKVVIIGQDPYHGTGQAHGLCFSVNKGVSVPPSLQNIYKEIQADLGSTYQIPPHGDLTHWANQGVLLLNATLTVEKDKAGSHQGKGWEQFTDEVIKQLNEHKEHLVFMLWGKFAQGKAAIINPEKHLVLKAAHPSPFSAYQGFFGCGHFSAANAYLKAHQHTQINW